MSEGVGISVLMTTYNRERYVESAIQSVCASTFKDFELIVSDDGSQDQTVDIVRRLAEADSRIKLYINPKNLGDYANRNKAASHATGKYLKYVDADDLIYPWGLETLWTCMERFPEAGWGLCSLGQDRNRAFPFILHPMEAYQYHYLGPGLFHKAPLSSIIRRSVFEDEGGFRNVRMVGDSEMWHRLGQTHPVVLMPHGMVWYRFHDDQESTDIHQYAHAYQEIRQQYLTDPLCPLEQKQLDQIYARLVQRLRKEWFLQLLRRNFIGAKSISTELIKLRPFVKSARNQ